MKYVIPLHEASPLRWMTGPKAESLAKLIAAGHRVPPGIAIGYHALVDHLAENGLSGRVDELLEEIEARQVF